MTTKKKQFKAHLIKYRTKDNSKFLWFWVNPESGSTLSPFFQTQELAEAWFDEILMVHNETYNLIDRVKNGKFYMIRARVDVEEMLTTPKTFECPFTIHLEDDIIDVEVLGVSLEDAKSRVEEYFDIIEWIE
jgi:hypothetical protein